MLSFQISKQSLQCRAAQEELEEIAAQDICDAHGEPHMRFRLSLDAIGHYDEVVEQVEAARDEYEAQLDALLGGDDSN